MATLAQFLLSTPSEWPNKLQQEKDGQETPRELVQNAQTLQQVEIGI